MQQIGRAPFADLLLGDAAAYSAWAHTIASGDWIGDRVFYQAPLYPYFLAATYTLFGSSIEIVRHVQAVLGVISCLLLADAARRLISPAAGVAAGLLLAFYAPAIFQDTIIQKTALDELLLCLILWLIARDPDVHRGRTAAYVGLASGTLILNRENAAVLVIPLAAWFATRARELGGRRALAFLGAVALVLAPVAARNKAVGGEWVVTTAQFGPNFYIGNNPDADGTYRPLVPWRGSPTFEQDDATKLAEHELGRPLTPGQVSAFYRDRVLRFIAGNPLAWLRLVARKLFLTINATEIPDTEDQYTYALWSWPLRTAAIWNFASLLALAALGGWIVRARWRQVWILPALVSVYAASLALFYVFARYRYLLVPPLMLLAAAAVAEGPSWIRRISIRERAVWAAVVAAIVIACSYPILARTQLEAVMRFNTGVGLKAEGRVDEAIAEYRVAAALNPAMPQVHYNLGIALQERGRMAEAIAALREAVRLAPDDPRALNNLGVALGLAGASGEAAECFRSAIARDPNLAEARRNLAENYATAGDLASAARELDAAIRLDPSSLAAWKTLTRVRAQQGHTVEALAAAETAARLAPHDPAVLNALGIAMAQAGRTGDAVAAFERALAEEPGNESIRRNLDRVRGRSVPPPRP